MRAACSECGETKELEEVIFQGYFSPPEVDREQKEFTPQEIFDLIRGEGPKPRMICAECKTMLLDVFEFPLYVQKSVDDVTEKEPPMSEEELENTLAQMKELLNDEEAYEKAKEAILKQQQVLKDALEEPDPEEDST